MRHIKLAGLVITLCLGAVFAGQPAKMLLKDYQGVFTFIANQQDLGEKVDAAVVFKLAVESDTKSIENYDGSVKLLIVMPHFHIDFKGTAFDTIRGVSGNGSIYVFRITKEGYQLAGELGGNGYRFESKVYETHPAATSWYMITGNHGGYNANSERKYEWSGSSFTFVSSETIKQMPQ